MGMGLYNVKQALGTMVQGGSKSQSEIDLNRRIVPLLKAILNLPFVSLLTSDVEARKFVIPVVGNGTKKEDFWGIAVLGNPLVPIADFGNDPSAEHNARTVADLLNAVRMFRVSI